MAVTHARLLLGLLMVGIYFTLGVVHDVTRMLRSAGMLRITIASVSLLAVGLGLRWLSRRGRLRHGRTWLVLSGAAALYALAIGQTVTLEETLHLLEYGLVGILARLSVPLSWTPTRAWVGAWTGAVVLGAIDEAIQGWLPNRTGDVRDVLLNAVAAGLPLLVGFLLTRVSGEAEPASPDSSVSTHPTPG